MNNLTRTNPTVTFDRRIPVALLLLRLSIFIVMLMWTLDKFVRLKHAASVYENYYFVGGLSRTVTLTECCNCGIVDQRGKTDAGFEGTQPARDTLAEA